MKNLLFVLFFVTSLAASQLQWTHNYTEALQKASKSHKIVYVLISSRYCKWCRKFEQHTLEDKSVQKKLASDFITVHLSREDDNIPALFKTAPVPRHYFVKADGSVLYTAIGYRDVEMFEAFMEEAEHNNKENK